MSALQTADVVFVTLMTLILPAAVLVDLAQGELRMAAPPLLQTEVKASRISGRKTDQVTTCGALVVD